MRLYRAVFEIKGNIFSIFHAATLRLSNYKYCCHQVLQYKYLSTVNVLKYVVKYLDT